MVAIIVASSPAPLTVVSVAVYLLRYWARYALDPHPDVKQVFRFCPWLTTGMNGREPGAMPAGDGEGSPLGSGGELCRRPLI
ncbi:hypothetical protein [Azotobacter chroococcum]|uniref:hypothetical protein n=1 Tax=Azotobacter chroococcum TaxID=353 RepID=UPI0010ADA5E1|nr:hypothetical protein [Azotobacter chroococcum]TKD35620.1 hypothetical protein FCG41_17495 [Azotobacter chroococcum]